MAYAALFSLAQTTNQILNDDRFPISDNGKHQITSLLEHLTFLQEFLEKFPNEASSLEVRIRRTANEAEDHLERLMYDQIQSHHMDKIYEDELRKEVAEKINSFSKKVGHFKCFNTTVKSSLLKHFTFLQKFLEKFPNKASSSEVTIRHTANEAEDHLERLMYDQIQSHHMEKIYDGPYDFDELIKEVAEKINSISKEAADFKSLNTTETVVLGDASTVKSLPDVGGVTVGLDDDLMKIKDLLCGMSSKLEVIPIVGMGGIGKTTLAVKAYHDQLIVESFHVRAWVTISQDYKPQNIFADLLDFCKGVGDEGSGKSNDFAQDKVYKFLKGRKYLIVLDDMWSTKAWDEVKTIFPDDGNGSRIVVTTRIEDVGSYADSSNYLHRMHFMESDRSWDLLKQKVFPDKDCPPELEDIGKLIARSCGGLPLAIVLVAGILSSVDETHTRVMWLEVAKKVRLAIDGEDGHFKKIISLSYTHLPHHLRACFLYMGGFPEDYKIRVSKLTKLWVAEGFVEPRDGKSLEERAEEYLEDLVKRSLALVKKRKSNGKIKSCSVHDLVRDICKRKAMEEDYHRRLSIDHHDLMSLARTEGSTLRSVICFQPSKSSLRALKVLRLLRVLDLGKADIDSFPDQVFDLFHLRYLGFTINSNLKIPSTISRLQNLRTLIIYLVWKPSSGLPYELCLPFEICMIPLLRHLVSWCPLLLDTEGVKVGTFTKLEKLVTLSLVKRFICTTKVIEMIPNIKKLGIIIHSGEEDDYHLHNLVLLSQLEKFKLVVEGDTSAWSKVNPVFPETLKKLVLDGCRFPWKYMEVVGSLPNLRVLKLGRHGCEGDTWETNEEQFPNLEFLWIDWCDLKNWVTERSHFPRLERLALLHCLKLKEIPDDIGEIPTLKLIELDDSNRSLVECAKRIREEQHDYGNYGLEVEVRYIYNKKVVLKLGVHGEKEKKKAMKAVSSLTGIESLSMDMDGKKLTVVGEVDPIKIVGKLKKCCHTALVTVGPAKEPEKKKEEPKKEEQRR